MAGYGWKFGESSCLFFSLVIPRDRGFAFLSVAILANESDHSASQMGGAAADAGARALRLMGCLLRRVMSGTLAVVQWAAHTYRGVLRPSPAKAARSRARAVGAVHRQHLDSGNSSHLQEADQTGQVILATRWQRRVDFFVVMAVGGMRLRKSFGLECASVLAGPVGLMSWDGTRVSRSRALM